MMVNMILMILALVCFLLGAIGVSSPRFPTNWVALGLALCTLAFLLTKG